MSTTLELSPEAKRRQAIDRASQTYQRILGRLPDGPMTLIERDMFAINHKAAFSEAIRIFEKEMAE